MQPDVLQSSAQDAEGDGGSIILCSPAKYSGSIFFLLPRLSEDSGFKCSLWSQ